MTRTYFPIFFWNTFNSTAVRFKRTCVNVK